MRTIDAAWLLAAREAIDAAIFAGEFHMAQALRRYVVERHEEDKRCRRGQAASRTWARKAEEEDRREGACEVRDCGSERVHPDARGCADHWPRFDGGRWPNPARADAWAREERL